MEQTMAKSKTAKTAAPASKAVKKSRPGSGAKSAAASALLPGVPFKLPRVSPEKRGRAHRLRDLLAEHYPNAYCELNHSNPHELLVATICSAQATDVSVNKCTPALFTAYPTPADYAKATPEQIEPYIRTIGLFRSKAKAICQTMRDIVEKFGGQVPPTMDQLLTLRGVARKTANVVLGNIFKLNVGFVVDTHVYRLSQRLGLVPWNTPVPKAEKIIMACFADFQSEWCDLSHRLIFHGRGPCKARGGPGGGCSNHAICRELGQKCELRGKGKPASP